MVDGNLYQCLEDREVDMLLGNNTDAMERFRVVAEFDSQPYYIVTTPDNQEILDGMNMALGKIVDSNPNFAEERYNANFPDSGIAVSYTHLDVYKRQGSIDGTIGVSDGCDNCQWSKT